MPVDPYDNQSDVKTELGDVDNPYLVKEELTEDYDAERDYYRDHASEVDTDSDIELIIDIKNAPVVSQTIVGGTSKELENSVNIGRFNCFPVPSLEAADLIRTSTEIDELWNACFALFPRAHADDVEMFRFLELN